LGGLTAALFLFLQDYAAGAADEAFDRVLAAAATSIAEAVRVEDGQITLELPSAALTVVGASRLNRVFYAVHGPDGSLITGYPGLTSPSRTDPTDAVVHFVDGVFLHQPVRIGLMSRYFDFGAQSGWMSVTIAETREARSRLAFNILRHAFLPVVPAMIAAFVLVWAALTRAVAPLRALETELATRMPHDLAPIQAPTPREISTLVNTINAFMQRLDGIVHPLRGLVADAAHQVRTPLASIVAQAQVALTDTDPASLRGRVQRILANSIDATRIVNQLLTEANVIHHSSGTARSRCDLRKLCLEALARLAKAEMERCRFTTKDEAHAGFCVAGHELSLRELIANLIDNALKYAPASHVEIALSAVPHDRMIRLQVADRGPGIPDAEKALVMLRFQRGASSSGVAGSGLGLSIAQCVAASGGGQVSLLDREGGGLVVRVDLKGAGPE